MNQKTLQFVFPKTVPVLVGYLFMGIAFGLLLNHIGYSCLWAFFISLTVFSGTLQFLLITFLGGGFSLLTVALMTLFINGRYMFYGLSFLDSFKRMGAVYPYMIHALTDETYSLLCAVDGRCPNGISEARAMQAIAVLDHLYWIAGCVLGAAAGSLISFDITGVDFAMTALFVVVVIDQWRDAKNDRPLSGGHLAAAVGAVCGAAALLIFKADGFILPALALTTAALVVLRPVIEKREARA